ncbi:MAG: APC family permease [Synergistaceae bacterium]|nr:APC family permease [Synergistaceae bacterium]
MFFIISSDRHLKRSLTPLNVWSLAFGCVIGWSAFVMPGTVFLPNAGPMGTLIAMEIATFVMLIISYNYSYMINKFPLTGGEFIYAKMAFGEHHGFLCAWFLSLSYLSVIPLNATALNLIMRAVFGDAFQFGFHYTVAGYDVYFGEMLLAIGVLLIFMIVNSWGVKFTGSIQTLLVMILLGGILIIIGGAAFSPNALSDNLLPMFRPADGSFTKGIAAQIAAVFVTGPMSFVGFDTVPQLTEESKFSADRVKVVMDTSIMCGGFVYIALALVACSAVPASYTGWVEHIKDLPNLSGINGIATLSASYNIMGKFGLTVITASVIAAMLTGIIGFYMATSRLLYSMARDGMIPSWFSYLNENGVPTNAGLFCTVVSGLTCLMGRPVMGWVFDMASTGAAIGFAYTSIAAAKYAFREKRTDIMIFGILGFILSVMMAVLLLFPIPGLNISLGSESYSLLFVWVVIGTLFYVIKRTWGGGQLHINTQKTISDLTDSNR